MLNDIRLHLDPDEAIQSQIEREIQPILDQRFEENRRAFKQYIPSIGNAIAQIPFTRLSVFVDKYKQTNIVDFNTGNTLYGYSVDSSIEHQIKNWAYYSALLDSQELSIKVRTGKQNSTDIISSEKPIDSFPENRNALSNYAHNLQIEIKNADIDTIVCLGIGKATHLAALLSPDNQAFEMENCKSLVIYEQDWEVFRCSLSTFDWASLLLRAQDANQHVFMQIGTPVEQVFDEITELQTSLNASRILFYKHTNYPHYCHILNNLRCGYWGRSVHLNQANSQASAISKNDKSIEAHQLHYLHHFSAIDSHFWRDCQGDFLVKAKNLGKCDTTLSGNRQSCQNRFAENMALFKEYFPDIHEVFKDYEPSIWLPIYHEQRGDINMVNIRHGSYFSGDTPKQEALALASHFATHPHVDGLVFGYSGDKQKHYSHNTFIRQADKRLFRDEQEQGSLPTQIKALLVFGLGSGYMLEALANTHSLGNLIICEPNPDFFYASLYAIDWTAVVERVNDSEHKLYINIGEASSRLFKDLMSQFLVLGPHLLNETYIMQAYQNPELHQVLTEVRQQLKVIFAMGENFDHVAYGIAHSLKAMHDKVPALRSNPSQYLTHKHKQTPIFLVGNGPSLDDSIEIIKEHRDQVIVVSCGTALQALYKNGIRPDFHGEVEQNRANFDWASRINDRDYLKQITLLSVNGIHPDTYQLYKNVLFSFKSGESATQSLLAMFPENSFESIDNAYPTVTNMALSFFLSLGFEQIYLVGVDLGFADQDKHHSVSSGYYENGKQLYDYKSVHAADMRVKGNRQDWVFTKTEFNISRMIIEQLLKQRASQTAHRIECFNLSNGVYISGTMSLHPDDVLVVNDNKDKEQTLAALDNCFMTTTSDVYDLVNKAYSKVTLDEHVNELLTLTSAKITDVDQVHELISDLTECLHAARKKGKSLFFYYFFNSVNYLNAALNKASLYHDECIAIKDCQFILDKWLVFLQDAQHMISHQFTLLDSCEAFSDRREKFLISDKQSVSYISFNSDFRKRLDQSDDSALFESTVRLVQSFEQACLFPQSPLIIDIVDANDIHQLLKALDSLTRFDISVIQSKGLVFHDSTLMQTFLEHHSNIAKTFCLLYLPLPIMLINDKSLVEDGLIDTLSMKDYFHAINARAYDTHLFSFIFVKARFCKTALTNTRQFLQSASDFLADYLTELGLDLAKVSKVTPIINDDSQAQNNEVFASEDEYSSLAVAILNAKVLPYLDIKDAYMFKHYIGMLRETDNGTYINVPSLPNLYESPANITITDALENRGMLMARKPFAFELLGQWYSPEDLQG